MNIIVNGRRIGFLDDSAYIDYATLVKIVFGNTEKIYTVVYCGRKSEGSLTSNEKIEVEPGMIFNVMLTNAA